MSGGSRGLYLIISGISLILLVLMVFYFIAGGLDKVFSLVASNPLAIVVASSLIALEEALKSTRFVIAARALNRNLGRKSAIKVHFASLAVGIITPAFSGALPTQAAMLGDTLRVGPSEAMAIAMSVTFFDSVFPALLTATASIVMMPYSLPLLLIAVGILFVWALILGAPLADKVGAWVSRAVGSQGLREFIEAESRDLRPHVMRVLGSLRAFAAMLVISVSSYMIECLSVFTFTRGSPLTFLRDFLGLLMSYVGGNLPTPGGVGGVEYSLLLLLPRGTVVLWRISYLLVGAASLSLFVDVIRHYVDYARQLRRRAQQASYG